MATELILMEEVENLGREGDIVRVAPGYARNYLLPRKLAEPVTKGAVRRVEKIRVERDLERKRELDSAVSLKGRLEAISCTIPVKVGENMQLYGSVTPALIAEAVEAQGVPIDRHDILLKEPLHELGDYEVAVKLHADVEALVKIIVVEE